MFVSSNMSHYRSVSVRRSFQAVEKAAIRVSDVMVFFLHSSPLAVEESMSSDDFLGYQDV